MHITHCKLGSGVPLDGDDLRVAHLDVSPTGQILFTCPLARAFLQRAGAGLRLHLLLPGDAIRAALRDAASAPQAKASVLYASDPEDGALVQINILPLTADRVRLILFLPQERSVAPDRSRPELTERERAVLTLTATGLRRDRVAHALGIALSTVDMHRRNIRQKLGGATISAAIAIATREGILEPEHQAWRPENGARRA